MITIAHNSNELLKVGPVALRAAESAGKGNKSFQVVSNLSSSRNKITALEHPMFGGVNDIQVSGESY